MWKVKRMNTARIVVLTIAVGGRPGRRRGPILRVDRTGKPPPERNRSPQTADRRRSRGQIRYRPRPDGHARPTCNGRTWPAGKPASNTFHSPQRSSGRDPPRFAGLDRTASPFIAGEPIRETKLIRGQWIRLHGPAILPLRACVPVFDRDFAGGEAAAGGFILPNDRSTVLLTPAREETLNRGSRRPRTSKVATPSSLTPHF